jgi:phosphoglycolate phosphatase
LIRKKVALLWDIDGTLISTNGLGRAPLLEAIQITTGLVRSYDLKSTSGFTDHQIVNMVLSQDGLKFNQITKTIEMILDLYCELYSNLVYNKKFILLNQMDQILNDLMQRENVLNLICTGNVLKGAKLKLSNVGLDKFFKEDNFFCSQSIAPRSEIVHRAMSRSLELGFVPIVIGDTAHDIEAARLNGLRSIGLESPNYSIDLLKASKPDSILSLGWGLKDLESAINLE